MADATSFREWLAAIDRGDAAVVLEMRRLWQQGQLDPAQEQVAIELAGEGIIPPRDAPIDESDMSPAQTNYISDEDRGRIAESLREDPYGHLASHDYGGTAQVEGLPPSRIRSGTAPGGYGLGPAVWAEPGQAEYDIKQRGLNPADFPKSEPPAGVKITPPADTELRRFGDETSGMKATGEFEREYGEPVKPLGGMPEGLREAPGEVHKDIWSMTPDERLAYRMARVKALSKAPAGGAM